MAMVESFVGMFLVILAMDYLSNKLGFGYDAKYYKTWPWSPWHPKRRGQ